MSLSKSSLKSALQNAFSNPVSDPIPAALALANAYHDYAKAAQFGINTPTLPNAKRDTLAATLLVAMQVSAPTPAAFIAAWSLGLTNYWTGVAVVGTQAGTTTPPTGNAALVSSLTTLFAAFNDAAAAADGLSTALDTCTKTVIATVTPPAGTVLPIS